MSDFAYEAFVDLAREDVAHHVDAYVGYPEIQQDIVEQRAVELAVVALEGLNEAKPLRAPELVTRHLVRVV